MARWHTIQAAAARMEHLGRCKWSVWSAWSVWGVWSVWSGTSEVTQIKLKISNSSGGIVSQHPISDEFKPTMSLTYVFLHSDQHGGETVCGHRPELTGPRTGLRSAWGTAGTCRHRDGAPGGDSEIPPALCVSGGLHELGQDGRWFSGVSGTWTARTVQQGWWYISHDRSGKRAAWDLPVQKWAGKHVVFFPPWVSSATTRMMRMAWIVQNDQAVQYKRLKRLYLHLSRLVCTPL